MHPTSRTPEFGAAYFDLGKCTRRVKRSKSVCTNVPCINHMIIQLSSSSLKPIYPHLQTTYNSSTKIWVSVSPQVCTNGSCSDRKPQLRSYASTYKERAFKTSVPMIENQMKLKQGLHRGYMSHSLNSLKGGYIGDYIGDYYRA